MLTNLPNQYKRRNELTDPKVDQSNSSLNQNEIRSLVAKEVILALGLVVLILGAMWISTGSFPPMVVVESGSMMHDLEDGSIGAIDAGDLILVMNPSRRQVITLVEATQEDNPNYNYHSHGMPGDVVIYKKNGGSETPVIHRALLKVVANSTIAGSETWDVRGTSIKNVQSISMTLDYNCKFHGNLTLINWIPSHEGYLTTGDNPSTNGCKIDQLAATGQDPRNGLKDEFGNPVTAVKEEWILGIASSELPWVGSIKLLASGNHQSVTDNAWFNLTVSIILLLAIPGIIEGIPKISSPEEE